MNSWGNYDFHTSSHWFVVGNKPSVSLANSHLDIVIPLICDFLMPLIVLCSFVTSKTV